MARMTLKVKKTKDQEKHGHRDSFKGHKTKAHFVAALQEQDADDQIREASQRDLCSLWQRVDSNLEAE